MCHKSCLNFGMESLRDEYVRGKSVIEIGSMNIGGSLRPIVESLKPGSYIGVDIQMGPGVDRVCKAEDLIKEFGRDKFDLLICTELLEHVEDWRSVMHNLKQVIKPGGAILISTRSRGFMYHGYPFDCWRYEISDMEYIFSDFDIKVLKRDPQVPGVFLLAVKPPAFIENETSGLELMSVVLKKRVSIKTARPYWKMAGALLRILGLNGDRIYYAHRIVYYSKHPFEAFSRIGTKLSLRRSA